MSGTNIVGVPYRYRLANRDGQIVLQALHYLHNGELAIEQWIDLPTIEIGVDYAKKDESTSPHILDLAKATIAELEARLNDAGKLLEDSDKKVKELRELLGIKEREIVALIDENFRVVRLTKEFVKHLKEGL